MAKRTTPASITTHRLSGALRLAVEQAVEAGLETDGNPTNPTIVGTQVAEAIERALAHNGASGVLSSRNKREFARRFATTYRDAFERRGRAWYLFNELDPADVIDLFAAWARIEWSEVDAAKSNARAGELAEARQRQRDFESERVRIAALPFTERIAEGGWVGWLTDPALRTTLLAPEARAIHAPFVARSLGPAPPRAPSGLALLALLGDADASEELATQLGDRKLTGPARRVLEECAKQRVPTPVPAARVARAIATLAPSQVDAWLLAALCARRLARGELERALPEAAALVARAAQAIERLHDKRLLSARDRSVLEAALHWLEAAVKHGGAAITEAAHVGARSAIDQFLVLRERPWPDRAQAAIATRVLGTGELSEDDVSVLRRLRWAHPDLTDACLAPPVLAALDP